MTDGELAPGEPRRDAALGAWVLSRHADVAAALREPRLAIPGAPDGAAARAAHGAARAAAGRAVSPARLDALRATLDASARRAADALPEGRPVDLVSAFAAPWSLGVALAATGADPAAADDLAARAGAVFLAAAHATDDAVAPAAGAAAAALARALAAAAPRGGAGDAQAFVALAHTLPGLLAAAWLALLGHPAERRRLQADPAGMPRAVEELLRHAGPSRAVFRRAAADVSIGGARIGAGERVVLALAAANRDPARFPDPDRLDLGRDAAGHVALGRGAHGCPGGPLIRLALAAATGALLDAAGELEPAGAVAWVGGFAIRAPGTLPVVLRRAPGVNAEAGGPRNHS